MKVLLTGASGFLGWHTRVRLETLGGHDVVPVTRTNWRQLRELIADVDAVVHVAGVNRGTPAEVEGGNIALARDVAGAMGSAPQHARIVFANSIQSGNATPYGIGKETASTLLAASAAAHGFQYVDVRLPNLFGEHGRPHYNSFVQTFVTAAIEGRTPHIDDRAINLLHAQRAAQAVMEALEPGVLSRLDPAGTPSSVREVFDRLRSFSDLYATGDIPPLLSEFDVDLFNTLRAALFPRAYPIPLTVRSDERGALIEVVRAHGGQGQTFVSTTHPGVTRGEHYHLRKVERFVVVSGQARISLRRLYSDKVVTFEVDGQHPSIVDMPTMWTHNITNTGTDELTTLFWTHELFDPDQPDTHPQRVGEPTMVAP